MARRVLVLSCLVLSLLVWAAARDNPLVGSWKRNPYKSSPVPPGALPDRSYIITREAYGKDGMRMTGRRVRGNGQLVQASYEAEYDGRDYPYNGDPSRDSVSIRRLDPHRTVHTYKKNGAVVARQTRLVSSNGRTAYVIAHGPVGEILGISVWDKQ